MKPTTTTSAELPTLRTRRLLLRPFRQVDGPEVERLAGAFEIADTTLNVPHPYPPGGGAEWIATHGPAWEAGVGMTLAIALSEKPNTIIGAMGLAIAPQHARGELGYWIAAEQWGKGYATEAARAFVDFGFVNLSLHRIQAQHLVRNPASGRVMQKLGMQLEGVLRESLRKWDRFEDVACYGIIDTEWAVGPRQAGT